MLDRRASFAFRLTSRDLILVASVTKVAGNVLRWIFSDTVTMTGNPATGLQDTTLSSNAAPIGTTQVNPTTIDATYSVLPSVGNTWTLSSLVNLTGDPGIKVTQTGTVV